MAVLAHDVYFARGLHLTQGEDIHGEVGGLHVGQGLEEVGVVVVGDAHAGHGAYLGAELAGGGAEFLQRGDDGGDKDLGGRRLTEAVEGKNVGLVEAAGGQGRGLHAGEVTRAMPPPRATTSMGALLI